MPPSPLKTLPALVGSLILGMLAFTGVAAYFAATTSPSSSLANDQLLLLILAILGPAELVAFKLLIQPALKKQAAATAQSESPDRDRLLEGQFSIATLIPAAFAEGWGLFGAVTLFLTHQWPAIAAPLIAAAILASMLNTRARFERFREEATGQRRL